MDINLSSLVVFCELARTGSFTDTGRRWHMTQPAVSRMISRLESSVGLVLLERSPAGARLTPAGQAFLEHAREVSEAFLDFNNRLAGLRRRLDKQVLIGLDQSHFSALLRRGWGSHPQPGHSLLSLAEMPEQWGGALEARHYDVVLAGRFLRAGLSPDIHERVILRERGITVAWNPDFYPFDSVHFSFPDVLRTTILLPGRKAVTGFASFLTRWCHEAYGLQAANTIEFASEEEAAEAAIAGLGVLLAPGDALPRLGPSGSGLIHVRTFEFLLPEAFTYGVYYRSGEETKEILAACEALEALCRKLLF